MIGKILNECRELQCNSTANDEINLLHLMPGHRKNNYKSLLSRPVCGMFISLLIMLPQELYCKLTPNHCFIKLSLEEVRE